MEHRSSEKRSVQESNVDSKLSSVLTNTRRGMVSTSVKQKI